MIVTDSMPSLREEFENAKPKPRMKCGKFSFVNLPTGYRMPNLTSIFKNSHGNIINKGISQVSRTNDWFMRQEPLTQTIYINTQRPSKKQATPPQDYDMNNYDGFYDDDWIGFVDQNNSSIMDFENSFVTVDDSMKGDSSVNDSSNLIDDSNDSFINDIINNSSVDVNEEKPEEIRHPQDRNPLTNNDEELLCERDILPMDKVEKMYKGLIEVFGHDSFRNKQKEAIVSALLGHDVFVLMPTGAGKSLCYQLPAIVDSGITVVVSPLKALILDQITKLNQLKIPALSLTGEVNSNKCSKLYEEIVSGKKVISLLYVTPEKINGSEKFKTFLSDLHKKGMLSRFVIDEAHCITQWGHDFRPDYAQLNCLRKIFYDPCVPIMALTATATPKIVEDVKNLLSMKDSKVFISSFERPNLKYDVIPKSTKTQCLLLKKIKKIYPKQSGIFYCLSQKDCETLHGSLKNYGITSAIYHAGMSDKARSESQRQWMANEVQVICATTAFGMGVDKADVRFVIHFCMPSSIEGYYQESGRAGRDGLPSYCAILYTYSDSTRQRRLIDGGEGNNNLYKRRKTIQSAHGRHEKVNEILGYCESIYECRRKQLVEHFGEKCQPKCQRGSQTMCDNCEINNTSEPLYRMYNFTGEAERILTATMDISLTMKQLSDCYRGCSKKNQNSREIISTVEIFGRGSSLSEGDANRFLIKLIVDGYLKEEIKIFEGNGFTSAAGYLSLTSKGHKFLSSYDKPKFYLYISNGKGRKKDMKHAQLLELGILPVTTCEENEGQYF